MLKSAYELYRILEVRGYVAPMAAQVIIETFNRAVPGPDGKVQMSYVGTGENLKLAMESDRVNVFKAYYSNAPDTESTWIAGENGGGELMPMWRERLIHADVMVSKERIDTTIDFLLYEISQKDA